MQITKQLQQQLQLTVVNKQQQRQLSTHKSRRLLPQVRDAQRERVQKKEKEIGENATASAMASEHFKGRGSLADECNGLFNAFCV